MPRLSKIGAAATGAFGFTTSSPYTVNYLSIGGGGGGERRGCTRRDQMQECVCDV